MRKSSRKPRRDTSELVAINIRQVGMPDTKHVLEVNRKLAEALARVLTPLLKPKG